MRMNINFNHAGLLFFNEILFNFYRRNYHKDGNNSELHQKGLNQVEDNEMRTLNKISQFQKTV